MHLMRMCCWTALIYALTMVPGRAAAENSSAADQWTQVQSLARGEQVEVRIIKKKTVHGSVISASADEFVVNTEHGRVNIAKSEIRRVGVRRNEARLKKGLIGAVIGGLAGTLAIVVADGALTDGNGVARGAAAGLGAAGAMAGFTLRTLPPAYSTIYKAP